jgi:hypothetical protein
MCQRRAAVVGERTEERVDSDEVAALSLGRFRLYVTPAVRVFDHVAVEGFYGAQDVITGLFIEGGVAGNDGVLEQEVAERRLAGLVPEGGHDRRDSATHPCSIVGDRAEAEACVHLIHNPQSSAHTELRTQG